MSDILFPVFAGVAFIFLGRWMCTNPARLYPSWVASDPKSQFYPRFAKGFATTAIFVGSYAVVAGITARFLPAWFVISAAILAGIVGSFLLRPNVSSSVNE